MTTLVALHITLLLSALVIKRHTASGTLESEQFLQKYSTLTEELNLDGTIGRDKFSTTKVNLAKSE